MERSGIMFIRVRDSGNEETGVQDGPGACPIKIVKNGDRLLLLYMIPSTVSTTAGNQCIF
jgi:hypothetical protein